MMVLNEVNEIHTWFLYMLVNGLVHDGERWSMRSIWFIMVVNEDNFYNHEEHYNDIMVD